MKTPHIKPQSKTRPSLLWLALGLVLLGPASATRADDILVGTFDTDISALGWQEWRNYGYVPSGSVAWDGAQDADGNAGSGSLYITADWPQTGYDTGWHDIQFYLNTPSPYALEDYLTVEADIKIDVASSSLSTGGASYGISGLYLTGGNAGWKQVVGFRVLQATDGWQHISGSLAGLVGQNYTQVVVGLISQTANHTLTNTVRYWVDNVKLIGPPSVHTNRPALNIAKAPPAGLTCMATAPGDAWQRQMVRTVNGSYSWHTTTAASTTTTYAITIAALAGGAQSGFEAMMYLIPETGMSNPDGGSVDWDSANVAYFTITANANGTGRGNFRYKVNSPGGENFQSWTNHDCATGPLGTWQLTFNNDTNVTIMAPDGTSATFAIPDTDAANFQGNLIAYFGVRPAAETRIGQSATFSRIKITGAAATIDDTFVSAGPPYDLDPATWVRKASSPQGIFITAPDAKYWITWPQPDGGFTNVYATDKVTNELGGSQWKALPTSDTGWKNVGGNTRFTIINQSTLDGSFGYSPSGCFFGLFHQ